MLAFVVAAMRLTCWEDSNWLGYFSQNAINLTTLNVNHISYVTLYQ
jgi:hypothetical protein